MMGYNPNWEARPSPNPPAFAQWREGCQSNQDAIDRRQTCGRSPSLSAIAVAGVVVRVQYSWGSSVNN
jgi:hypothetical protein